MGVGVEAAMAPACQPRRQPPTADGDQHAPRIRVANATGSPRTRPRPAPAPPPHRACAPYPLPPYLPPPPPPPPPMRPPLPFMGGFASECTRTTACGHAYASISAGYQLLLLLLLLQGMLA